MIKMFLSFLLITMCTAVAVPLFFVHAETQPAGIVITNIQAGASGAATQEYIALYNNTNEDIDVSGWCVKNKNDAVIGCFVMEVGDARYLPAHAFATLASNSYVAAHPHVNATLVYTPLSQSSGSIIGGSDTISLFDHTGKRVDSQTWVSSLVGGMQYQRNVSDDSSVYVDTDTAADWKILAATTAPNDASYIDHTVVDLCPNIEGVQQLIPVGKVMDTDGECVDKVIYKLMITELLPNPKGADGGVECIELYNPNNVAVSLSDYELYVGVQLGDRYDFPADTLIEPHAYKVFTNSDIHFTLLNSSSKVLLALHDGTIISETTTYTDPPEGQSWAYINDTWQYTASPTPDAENVLTMSDATAAVTTLKPCAVNQYRSLETNRCRLFSSLVGSVTPCKDGQYRSEETNRCRNIANEVKAITPCATNQERNPETNRCRKIVNASTPTPCKEGQERSAETNRCRKIVKMTNSGFRVQSSNSTDSGSGYVFAAIVGVLLLAVGYAIWEWHVEMTRFFRKYYQRARHFARFSK